MAGVTPAQTGTKGAPVRIEMRMQVRGGERVLEWVDGVLSGDSEILRRLQPLVESGRVRIDDLVSVIRGAEAVTAQQVTLANLDLIEPDGVAVGTDGPRARS